MQKGQGKNKPKKVNPFITNSQAIGDLNLGTENLGNVFIESVKIGREIHVAFADGFQFMDAFTILNQYPAVQHIGQIAPVAFQELRDLTPEESAELATRISDETGLPNDNTLMGKIRQALSLMARTYKVVDDAKQTFYDWNNLFEATPELEEG